MEFEKIQATIAEQLGIDADDIEMTTSFEELGVDSLDLFQIISNIEDDFDIEFANDDAEKIKTVGDAVEYVLAHKSDK